MNKILYAASCFTGRTMTQAILLCLLVCASLTLPAQVERPDKLDVSGSVKLESKGLANAILLVLEEGKIIKQVTTAETGTFKFYLDLNQEYEVRVTKQNMITKKFLFYTQVPEMPVDFDDEQIKKFTGFSFEFVVSLFPEFNDPDLAILNDPVAIIRYNDLKGDFYYDEEYSESIMIQLSSLIRRYNKLISNYNTTIGMADRLMGMQKLDDAKAHYEKALSYFPKEQYPKDQIDAIYQIQNREKIVADKYNELISFGDNYFNSKLYPNAILTYEKAAELKPDEQYPKQKIKDIEKLLGYQQVEEDMYSKFIATADQYFSTRTFEKARENYKRANELRPKERYPVAKMHAIDSILSKDGVIQQAYEKIIASADKYFGEQQYSQSLNLYKQANGVKPEEKYPKTRIDEINKILTEREKTEKSYRDALANADSHYRSKEYDKAKEQYRRAIAIKSDAQYPKDQLTKIDNLLGIQASETELQARYDKAIASADAAFANHDYGASRDFYKEANGLKSNEVYPINQLAKINALIAEQEANREAYDKLVTFADGLFNQKLYENAIAPYQKASVLMPGEKYPKSKIAEINKMLSDLKGQEQAYKDAIAEADGLYTNKDYLTAKAVYSRAGNIKPAEQYPKDQIIKIDNVLAQLSKQEEINTRYKAAIAGGDKSFATKEYEGAIQSYQTASELKPDEQYPKTQIDRLNSLLAAAKTKDEAYVKLVAAGDQLFDQDDFSKSLLAFQKANELKPEENYPKEKISQINTIIAKKQGVEQAYNSAIAAADNYLQAKDLSNARMEYGKAGDIKPNEQYPKDQLAKIDRYLAALDEKQKLEVQYKTAIAEADKLFETENYPQAITAYNNAGSLKPDETYPKTQVLKITKLMASAQANQEAYDKLIAYGDQFFENKTFDKSLTAFTKAAELKPAEKYPKQKITELNKLIAQQQGAETAYNEAITSADGYLKAKELEKARTSYQQAADIKPAATYPKEQIGKIDDYLAKQASLQAEEQNYKTAIAEGDKAYSGNKYEEAIAAYTKAGNIKPAETYPKEQIAKINQLKTTSEAYDKLIAYGDQFYGDQVWDKALLAYEKASGLKADEKYPKAKIEEIKGLLAQATNTENAYKEALSEAAAQVNAKQFEAALATYKKASAIKPNEQYPKDQIAKLEQALATFATKEKALEKYNQYIAEADASLRASEFDKAITNYQKASETLPDKDYPKTQLAKLEKYLQLQQEKDAQYGQAISKGDGHFSAKDYKQAYLAYQEASKLKPNEQYPINKLDEITSLMGDLKATAYNDAIAEGDNLYNSKDYEAALPYYQKAGKLQPAEPYPANRIKEINTLLATIKGKENAYNEAIANGDRLLSAKEYEAAKGNFTKALSMKPGEKYPKDKLAEIETLMAAAARAREEYNQYIALADKLFGAKNYPQAKIQYEKANTAVPTERYPLDRMREIDNIIGSYQEEEYKKLIANADQLYLSKDLKSALDVYKKASRLRPGEQYPKDQIKNLSEVLDGQAYRDAIAEGDAQFADQDYEFAKLSYSQARQINPNDPYPLKKIAEINKLLQKDEFANAIDEIVSEFIAKNTTRKFSFTPIKNKSSSNAIVIKARNLSGQPFRILLNYGKDDSNNGGLVLSIDDTDEEKVYTTKVGLQSPWLNESNNWMSLSPVGGDVEILGISINEQ